MQTIKTGAIIVLLMTIVFSAYTSLTSPPDALPGEVVDALIFNDDGSFAIDDGMPPSLAGMDFGNPPADNQAASQAAAAPPAGLAFPGMGSNDFAATQTSAQSPTQNLPPPNFGADSIAIAADQNSGVNVGFSDVPPTAAFPTAKNSSVAAIPSSYPATTNQFAMPDPSSVELGDQAAVQWATAELDRPNEFGSSTPVRNVSARTNSTPDVGLANAIATADRQFEEGRMRDALATLSMFYTTPGIGAAQRSEMLSRLDYLAGNVIYSPRHLLETPHRVGEGETLLSIADDFQVPWQLLASINQVRDPNSVTPGTELKVMRGPLRANVDLSDNELTVFLGELYAGRFSVLAGNSPAPVVGSYSVNNKLPGKAFNTRTGGSFAASSPGNPYGNAYIDLGQGMSLHSSSDAASADPNRPGACLTLTPKDSLDLMGILSIGSKVEIKL